YLLPAQVNID
nr:neurotrophic factor [rats, Wistar, hippocampus, Peptide, 10 aa] [Rattus sp.]